MDTFSGVEFGWVEGWLGCFGGGLSLLMLLLLLLLLLLLSTAAFRICFLLHLGRLLFRFSQVFFQATEIKIVGCQDGGQRNTRLRPKFQPLLQHPFPAHDVNFESPLFHLLVDGYEIVVRANDDESDVVGFEAFSVSSQP